MTAEIAANFDLLPTFVSLAGGKVPSTPKIDGLDLTALLLGKTNRSPHGTHYYFSGNELQAVRSGPWKLAIVPQYEGLGVYPDAKTKSNFKPTLYNLEDDLGEKNDVAAKHPDIVSDLRKLIAMMDADLGLERPEVGVREPGHIANPTGLWLSGQMPALQSNSPARLENLIIGDSLDSTEAPQIAGKAFTVSCQVETTAKNGVIVAQGGIASGYAIYLKNGELTFSIREQKKLFSITSTNGVPGKFTVLASLGSHGNMILTINDQIMATGQAADVINRQPAEDLCIGFDNGMPVGEYKRNNPLTGKVTGLQVYIK